MGVDKAENRRRRTSMVGSGNTTLNGHKGRSQRGCFGRDGIKHKERKHGND